MYRLNIDQHWSTYASQCIFMDSEYNYQLYIHTYRSPRRLSPLLSGNGYHLYCPETTITFTVRKRPHPALFGADGKKTWRRRSALPPKNLSPPFFWGGGKIHTLPPRFSRHTRVMSYGVDFMGLGPLSQTTLLAHGHYQSIYIHSSVGGPGCPRRIAEITAYIAISVAALRDGEKLK